MNQFSPEFEPANTQSHEEVADVHAQSEFSDEAPSHLEMRFGVEIDEAVDRILALNPEGKGMRVSKLIRTSLQGLLSQQQDLNDFKEAAAAHPNIVQSTDKLFKVVPTPTTGSEGEKRQPRASDEKKSLDSMITEWQKDAPQAGGKRRSRKGGHKRRPEM